MNAPLGRPATIYDVADAAGVSISTVSNVLNKPGRVATSTRERVLAVADDLGYMPKAAAAQLARKRVGRVGVVAPFSSYPSYLRRLVGILRATDSERLEVSVFDQQSAATSTAPVLASLPMRGVVDGLLVMGAPIEASVEERLRSHSLPVVVIDADSSAFSVVNIDDFGAGAMAARHLLELGHRRIGYVLEEQASDYESQARRRLGGFRSVVEGDPTVRLEIVESPGHLEAARAVGTSLLARADPPTAVMAHFDDLALGVVQAARGLDLSVPEDVSVLGFDDGPVATAAGLSTIHQPFEESGEVGVGLLLDAMDGSRARRATLLDCTLVVRGTTGPPAVVRAR